jgi:hypothetical protein
MDVDGLGEQESWERVGDGLWTGKLVLGISSPESCRFRSRGRDGWREFGGWGWVGCSS